MLTLSIVLNTVIALLCLGGVIWTAYKDNFGERMGMVVVGIVCLLRAALAAKFEVAELSDVLLEAGIAAFGWGQMCAKRKALRLRQAAQATQQAAG